VALIRGYRAALLSWYRVALGAGVGLAHLLGCWLAVRAWHCLALVYWALAAVCPGDRGADCPGLCMALLAWYSLASLPWFRHTLLGGDYAARLPGYRVAYLVRDGDTLLVRYRVALCVRDIKTLFLGDGVAFGNRYLVRHWLTLGDGDGGTEFTRNRVAFGVGEGMAFMMRFRMALGSPDRVTLAARLGVRNIDTLLAGDCLAFLKWNILAELLGHGAALHLVPHLVALLLVDSGADGLCVGGATHLVEADTFWLNGNFKSCLAMFFLNEVTDELW